MKTIIKIFICLSLIYTPFFAFAGAAEKWDYEVSPIPDQNQRVVVTGHKVDQYGDAVNDSKYKTTIDPKTLPNKQKMGGVAIAKLLKKANWASVGVEAFQALLEGIDWVMDLEQQSIWRYKPQNDMSCKNFGFKWIPAQTGNQFNCPVDAATSHLSNICVGYLTECEITVMSSTANYSNPTLISTLPNDASVSRIYVRYYAKYNGSPAYYSFELTRGEKVQQTQPEKEYLTPETAADYANKTHPDYNNPAYKPKLDEKYKPEIVPNLWKPHNEWEKTNSPTVQEVERQLEQANPTSQDKDIEQKTDEQGNPTGFSLPEFCSWATSVCDFIKWVKDNPENEDEAPEIPQEIDLGYLDTGTFNATAGCPAPIQVPVNLGSGGNLEISYEPICQFAEKWSFVAPLIGFLSGAMILVGVGRKGEDGET